MKLYFSWLIWKVSRKLCSKQRWLIQLLKNGHLCHWCDNGRNFIKWRVVILGRFHENTELWKLCWRKTFGSLKRRRKISWKCCVFNKENGQMVKRWERVWFKWFSHFLLANHVSYSSCANATRSYFIWRKDWVHLLSIRSYFQVIFWN